MRNGKLLAITCIACIGACPLLAQEGGGDRPKPAARVYVPLPDIADNQEDANQETQAMQPDDRPLSGVQNPTLGTSEMRHSYLIPGIQYTNSILSNSLGQSSGWNSTSYMSGDLSMLEAWSRSRFAANYSGGGYVSTDNFQGSGQYHQLATAFELVKRRWQLLFVDQFSYLPESTFGFGGTSGLAFPGISGSLAVPLPGLQTPFVPAQTILTALGPRYSNASAVQLTYQVSPRGSITLATVYGLLRFINRGNINSDTEIFNVGYNYAITQRDTIGIIYRFSAYRYQGNPQALGDHVAQFAYGRKVKGRLALQLAAGPEITMFRVPEGGSTQRVSSTETAMLTYAFARGSASLSYMHGVSGGSGVFTGVSADQVNSTWSRQLTRVWRGTVNFGYAKNRQIFAAGVAPTANYDAWFAGGGLGRPLGHDANFDIEYQARIQNANVPLCSIPGCNANYTTHQILVNFQWHARPLVLR